MEFMVIRNILKKKFSTFSRIEKSKNVLHRTNNYTDLQALSRNVNKSKKIK